jgi:hypothetical protein
MGTPTSGGEAVFGSGGGSIALTIIDYTQDYTDIRNELVLMSQSLIGIESKLDLLFGTTGSTVVGTLSNSANQIMKVQADSLKNQGKTLENINNAMAAIGNLSSQVAALSNTVAQGVATQQIAVADQIKKNKFDQNATQAALERNGLPAVEVTTPEILDTITENASSALQIAASASAAGVAQNVASTAVAKASTYITGMLPDTTRVKEFFTSILKIKTTDAETAARVTETNLKAEAASLGQS